MTGAVASEEQKDARKALRRRRALKMVDRELSKGNYRAALFLVKQLNGKPGVLRGFGAAKQVLSPSPYLSVYWHSRYFRQRIFFFFFCYCLKI